MNLISDAPTHIQFVFILFCAAYLIVAVYKVTYITEGFAEFLTAIAPFRRITDPDVLPQWERLENKYLWPNTLGPANYRLAFLLELITGALFWPSVVLLIPALNFYDALKVKQTVKNIVRILK